MPSSLTLWFESNGSISLQKASFQHPKLTAPLVSERGTKATRVRNGTFRWSNGVRAFCALVVRYKLYAPSSTQGEIKGESGSIASSLDYAMSKEPLWLTDMFGVDANGKSLVHRIVTRINPERKRPGPVVLQVNSKSLPKDDIHIYLNESRVTEPRGLFAILSSICPEESLDDDIEEHREGSLKQAHLPTKALEFVHTQIQNGDAPFPFHDARHRQFLYKIYRREVFLMLHATNIFSPLTIKKAISRFLSDPTCDSLLGNNKGYFISLDTRSFPSERLGLLPAEHPHLRKRDPLHVVVEPGQAPALCVLYFLKYFLNWPVDIDFQVAHSVEVVHRLNTGSYQKEPDVCLLTTVASTALFSSKAAESYSPITIMPKISHRVVMPNSAEDMNRTGDFSLRFMTETPGTASFFYNNLVGSGRINPKKIDRKHNEPDEITYLLSEGDPNIRGLMAFPHYDFNVLFNNCKIIEDSDPDIGNIETLMLAHKRVTSQPGVIQSFESAVRHAWIELKTNSKTLEGVLSLLLSDHRYLKTVSRIAGLDVYLGGTHTPNTTF